MRKIGFIDYYISEWHSNTYPKWIAESNAKLGTDYKVAYVWAEKYVSPVDGRNTDEWCEAYGAEKCETLEELCEKSDVLAILAPSDPECHLKYARIALTYGKPTFIDKTFADCYASAKEMFDIAKAHNTPIFTASSLRFCEELSGVGDVINLTVTGDIANFNEYAVHQAEMAELLLGDKTVAVRVAVMGSQRVCMLRTEKGKLATLVYAVGMPYAVSYDLADGTHTGTRIRSAFFPRLIDDTIRFWNGECIPVAEERSLEVMRIRDALLTGESRPDEWITV